MSTAEKSTSSTPSTAGMKQSPSTDEAPPEYNVLFIGTHHKEALFEKLLCVAERYERHMQYQDTCYLYFNYAHQGPVVVEINDPGIEHTGAREMAIRKAHAVIMCYAAHSPPSFHELASLVDDFKPRKNGVYPPVILICNEDENLMEKSGEGTAMGDIDEEDLHPTQFPTVEEAICPLPSTMASSSHQSSTSEGYESQQDPEEDAEHNRQAINGKGDDELSTARLNSPTTSQRIRRASMDALQEQLTDEKCPISREQGETMARLFGPDCQFLPIHFTDYSYEEAGVLMESLIDRIIAHVRMNGTPSTPSGKERTSRKKSKSPPSSDNGNSGNSLLKEIKRRGSFIPLPPFFHKEHEPTSPKKDEKTKDKQAPGVGQMSLKSVYKSKSKSPMMVSKAKSVPTATESSSSNTDEKKKCAGKGFRKLSTVFTRHRAKSQSTNIKVSDSGYNGSEKPPPPTSPEAEEASSPHSNTTTPTPPSTTVVVVGEESTSGVATATPPSRKHSFRVAIHNASDADESKAKPKPAAMSSQARSHVCVIS